MAFGYKLWERIISRVLHQIQNTSFFSSLPSVRKQDKTSYVCKGQPIWYSSCFLARDFSYTMTVYNQIVPVIKSFINRLGMIVRVNALLNRNVVVDSN